MPQFCSFLVFRPTEIQLVRKICSEAGWSARDIPDPSMRYKYTDGGRTKTTQAGGLSYLSTLRDGEELGRLLVFETEQDEADNIIGLINAAKVVLNGFPERESTLASGFLLPNNDPERSDIFKNVFQTDGFFQCFASSSELLLAVAVAARAWSDRKLIYALHKLAQSYEAESVTPWSMHPRFGQIFEKHTDNFASHVGTSIAINLAYSAIEELGLTVGASREKPRSLEKSTFIWNPEVLIPFQNRLKKAGIHPETRIDWVARGKETEIKIYEMLNTASEYSDGIEVRDRQISIYDAINFCEFLRNQITAHSFSSSTQQIGPYEVYNTQNVARLLILSKCNLWNTSIEELKQLYSSNL